jgi:hypothetical protein
LDEAYLKSLLKSPEVASVLQEVAEEVKQAAGSGMVAVVDYDRRSSRYISMVYDPDEGAMYREASEGNLARAVGSRETRYVWR